MTTALIFVWYAVTGLAMGLVVREDRLPTWYKVAHTAASLVIEVLLAGAIVYRVTS